jgi:hypothetical protein
MGSASEFRKTWNESFARYAIDISLIYKNNPAEILNCLRFESVNGSLNETYQMLVKEGEIQPIETIEPGEKLKLWDKAKEYSDKKETCVMICKSIYLLNELTK